MKWSITVTKVAAAYVELKSDIRTNVKVRDIVQVVPLPRKYEIGSSVIFLEDDTTLNIHETVEQVRQLVSDGKEKLFFLRFCMN